MYRSLSKIQSVPLCKKWVNKKVYKQITGMPSSNWKRSILIRQILPLSSTALD